jgi:hypothetical protein
MTTGLHPQATKRLEEILAGVLRDVRVTNNSFLDYGSLTGLATADAALPGGSSDLTKRLAAFVSTEPFEDFVTGELTERVSRRPFDLDSKSTALTDIEEFAEQGHVAHDLVEAFLTLPWHYQVFASIPWELRTLIDPALNADEFAFNDRLALVRGASLMKSHPVPEDAPKRSLLSDKPIQLHPDNLYLRINAKGYISPYGGTVPMDDVQGLVRSFFGLCIALRWARAGASYSLVPPKRELLVYRATQEEWRWHSTQEIPSDAARLIDGLGHNKKLAQLDERVRLTFIDRELHELSTALKRTDESRPILLASQWLFDSWSSSNRLLGYVQAMVALEALLGDKSASDATGLGELLANRTAYLIAKTRYQRDTILADFRRIYDTRSKIVHRGKNRLGAADLKDLSTLEWFCARVIQEEVRFLGVPEE